MSDDNVIDFAKRGAPPDQPEPEQKADATPQVAAGLIETLERTIADIRSGEVVGVAQVAVHKDGATSSLLQGTLRRYQVRGEMDLLSRRLLDDEMRSRGIIP